MSYEKAMKWARKHPRGGKPQYMGFSSCSMPTPSIWSNPRFVVMQWFKQRNTDPLGHKHCREAIHEVIKSIREKENINEH